VVQAKTDAEGGEVTSDQIWEIFQDEYLPSSTHSGERWGRFEVTGATTSRDAEGRVTLGVHLRDGETVEPAQAVGNGPIDAFLKIMADRGVDVVLYDYVEHTLSAGGDATAASYVDLQVAGERLWGVGIDPDTSVASLKAIVSSVNRAVRARAAEAAQASENDALVQA
jgi:LeuA allosteric (dimerisation) domain.